MLIKKKKEKKTCNYQIIKQNSETVDCTIEKEGSLGIMNGYQKAPEGASPTQPTSQPTHS